MTVRVPLFPPVVRWALVAGVAAFIFSASILAPPPETPVDTAQPGFLPLDKWRHFVAYATLGYALAYATSTTWDGRRWRAFVLVVVLTSLYGAGIELGQSVIPDRQFDPGDVVANALGAALVLFRFAIRPRLELTPVSQWISGSNSTESEGPSE
ncbi:VanZ family protein [Natrarchaeobius oligotrophus]|uniref:VanZ family protein n=1 Tax=Natrarchaeobius chitinivorans TaxID=1679083 RepID=A0A3N6NM85_NATCH|nr:VanZ family protein [Natrarchaeobius chitinivorans]RQH00503.1 VanZ family protein [Natrarchaeobius chitinivorans]